jgi:hypothetical protein
MSITVTVKQETTVTLHMSEKFAEWLRSQMQNPLHGQAPVDEELEDARYRRDLFNALNAEIPI